MGGKKKVVNFVVAVQADLSSNGDWVSSGKYVGNI